MEQDYCEAVMLTAAPGGVKVVRLMAVVLSPAGADKSD
jgi:hypothetical protein